MGEKKETIKWNITWEQIEAQAKANERKNNPPKKRVKKYV